MQRAGPVCPTPHIDHSPLYTLDHRFGVGGWSVWATGGAGYTRTVYTLHEEGAYGLRVRATDHVGREGLSTAQTVVADRIPPTLTLALSESSPYAHVAGSTAYYGVGDGAGAGVQLNALTVTAMLADATAGLAQVVFPEATSPGAAYPLSGAGVATRTHVYTFTAASALTATLPITAADRATNATAAAFTVERDSTPPQIRLDAPARVPTGTGVAPPRPNTFTITWGATDTQAGVACYDLDVSVDGGPWQRVLTHTQATTYQQPVTSNQHYTFRLTATDHVSNTASVVARTSISRVTKHYHHGDARVALRAAGVVYWLHTDHLGSVSLITDYALRITAEQRFLPYGGVRYTQGTFPTDVGFTGHRAHPDLGLVYMRARYYHSGLGRFVSADTIVPSPQNPQALNRYSYVLGNPLRYTDPTGHFEEDEILQILLNAGMDESTARSIITDWQENAPQWWELLRKAQAGDYLDAVGASNSRWIGKFVEEGGKVSFEYQRYYDYQKWKDSADEVFVDPSYTYKYLDTFYRFTHDIILARQGSDGNYRAWAGTGVYYLPHLGYDTPRVNPPAAGDWGWALGEIPAGCYLTVQGGSELFAGLATSPVGWGVAAKGLAEAAGGIFLIRDGVNRVSDYVSARRARERLAAY